MDDMHGDTISDIVESVGMVMINTVEGIHEICAERSADNGVGDDIPPVLFHQVVKIRGRQFATFLQEHSSRLKIRWSDADIDRIEHEHDDLLTAYRSEPSLKDALDACDMQTGFKEGWDLTQGRFLRLREFCGGLASVFPGTANVESDFSVVKWEKDDSRTSLTDFSLEGILHSKQFEELQNISVYVD